MNSSLPEQFEQFADARKQGFLKAQKLKEDGGKLAGIFCSFTPVEILDAAGFVTVGLCGSSEETIPDAEVNLPKNICPLIKSSYGFALSKKCPYTYFSDIIVGETTCDGKKKMYEMLGELKDVFILHLPQGADESYVLDMWVSEIKRLIKHLEDKFSIKITDAALRKAAEFRNKERQTKIELFELNKSIPPMVYMTDIHKVTQSLEFSFDRKESLDNIEKLIEDIKKDYKNGNSKVKKTDKRILVTGCPIIGVVNKTVSVIEEKGGCVVVLDSCSGIKPSREMVDTKNDDIIMAIAKRYVNIGCAVMTPNNIRLKQMRELVDEYKVDGVVEIVLQNCQTFDIESYKIRNLSKEIGIPYLKIETDYSKTDQGQISTRLEAFMEML